MEFLLQSCQNHLLVMKRGHLLNSLRHNLNSYQGYIKSSPTLCILIIVRVIQNVGGDHRQPTISAKSRLKRQFCEVGWAVPDWFALPTPPPAVAAFVHSISQKGDKNGAESVTYSVGFRELYYGSGQGAKQKGQKGDKNGAESVTYSVGFRELYYGSGQGAKQKGQKGDKNGAESVTYSGSLLAGLYLPVEPTTGYSKRPMCQLNLGNLVDVQERHITNRKFRDSGVHGQFDRSGLMWEMTVEVGGVCSLTSEVLAILNKVVPPLPYFNWRCWFRAGLPFLGRHHFEMRRPLLPNLTHPEYPVTPEAAQRFLQD
ncbi:hypothetical protein J6590_028512 [Homalodisca vitripennis]|nr:hypothetical protein J6590_028512 [Homalodisca vitripennis]